MDIKVFVSSLGAYNEGTLTGRWTELPVDDVQKDILDKVEGAVGDEYFITDYEAPFHIDEYASLEDLNKLAEALEDKGIDDLEDLYDFVDMNNLAPRPLPNDDDNVNMLLEGCTPMEAINALAGNYSPSDDLVRLDSINNLESMSEDDWQRELKDHADDMIKEFCSEECLASDFQLGGIDHDKYS